MKFAGVVAVVRQHNKPHVLRFEGVEQITVLQLKEALAGLTNLPPSHQRLVCGARELPDGLSLGRARPGAPARPHELEFLARVVGGKGGFGAMLRSARGGLDSKKTTNFDAMRDLSGRRMRHVNNEKKVAEWVAGAPERERQAEAEQAEKGRLKRERQQVHVFAERQYAQTVESVRDTVAGGVAVGIIAAKKRQREQAEAARRLLEGKPSLEEEEARVAGAAGEVTKEVSADATDAAVQPPPAKRAKAAPVAAAVEPAQVAPSSSSVVAAPLEWGTHTSAASLLSGCGAEAIKGELMRLGLKCGGTPEQRAERLWSTKGKSMGEIDPRLFAKKKGGMTMGKAGR